MGSCGRTLCAGPGEGSKGTGAVVGLHPGLTARLTAQTRVAVRAPIPTVRWGSELGPAGPPGTKHRERGASLGRASPESQGCGSRLRVRRGPGPRCPEKPPPRLWAKPELAAARPGAPMGARGSTCWGGPAQGRGTHRAAAEEGHWAVSNGASEVGQLIRSACRPSRSSREVLVASARKGPFCWLALSPAPAQPRQTQAPAPRMLRGQVGWPGAETPFPLLHRPGDLHPLAGGHDGRGCGTEL